MDLDELDISPDLEAKIFETDDPEEIEALLNSANEPENVDEQHEEEPAVTEPEKNTDEEGAPSGTEEQGDKQEDQDSNDEPAEEEHEDIQKVVLSKDGKYEIPYEVLDVKRKEVSDLRQQVSDLTQKLTETDSQKSNMAKVLEENGIDPTTITDGSTLTKAQLEAIAEESPAIAKVLESMQSRYVAMSEQVNRSANNVAHDPLESAIQSNPDLSKWRHGDPDRWDFAVAVDDRLREDPQFKDKSVAERFEEVARRTHAAFGSLPQKSQEPSTDRKAKEKIAEAAAQVPGSLSDMGQSPATEKNEFDQLSDMSTEQLEAWMESASPEKLEQAMSYGIGI